MENQGTENNMNETEMYRKWEHQQRRGRVFGGLIIVGAGVVYLAQELGAAIPYWVISWKMFLIVLGLFIGFKHMFRHFSWIILVTLGTVLLLEDLVPGINRSFIIAILAICAGLVMMFKPRRKHKEQYWKYRMKKHGHWRHQSDQYACGTETTSSEDCIDSVSVFGGVKKNIISKNFKGGDITNIFGGAEINLSQADINGKVILDVTQVFGGTRLIVPPHWEIQSELAAIMGSVEDKRQVQQAKLSEETKTLVLRGTTIFGGIDIKSF